MTPDDFLKHLEEQKRTFLDEVASHFRTENKERGELAFDRWKKQFVIFLEKYVWAEADTFKSDIDRSGYASAIAGASTGETSYDRFMRQYGRLCLAFIEHLVDSVKKGYIEISETQSLEKNNVRNSLINTLLTPFQRLWLETLYAKGKNGEKVSKRALEVELQGKGSPEGIRGAFLRRDGITILGIALVDPESEHVKNTDKVIQAIRETIEKKPDVKAISAQEIYKKTKVKEQEVANIFEDLAHLGIFHHTGTNYGLSGWATINIDDKAFEDYRKFENLQQIIESLVENNKSQKSIETIKNMQNNADPKKVFVVHGRNEALRRSMFDFLRAIGLEPIEWSEAIRMTGKGSPYVGDVLDTAFSVAQAIVVLMTPDDEARLREEYRGSREPVYETELTGQPRQNVLIEAGMALGRNPDRTILIEIGDLRPMSDIVGRHIVRLDNSVAKRQDIVDRLETAECTVNIKGKRDWHTIGNFEITYIHKTQIQNSQSEDDFSLFPLVDLNKDEIEILKVISEENDISFDSLQKFFNNLRPAFLKHYLNNLCNLEYIKKLSEVIIFYKITPKGLEYLVKNSQKVSW